MDKLYKGYTESDEKIIALVNDVVLEMHESWKMINSPSRENPKGDSVLKFAAEGARALNARNDVAVRKLLSL